MGPPLTSLARVKHRDMPNFEMAKKCVLLALGGKERQIVTSLQCVTARWKL